MAGTREGVERRLETLRQKSRDCNRWCNLQPLTRSRNAERQQRFNTPKSGDRGVRKVSRNCYEAQLRIGRRSTGPGYFKTPEEAARDP